jgi:hypothetical protein
MGDQVCKNNSTKQKAISELLKIDHLGMNERRVNGNECASKANKIILPQSAKLGKKGV